MGRHRKHADTISVSVSTDRGEWMALREAGWGPTAIYEIGVAVVHRMIQKSRKPGVLDALVDRDPLLQEKTRQAVLPGAMDEIIEETLLRRRIEAEVRGELTIENQDEESLDQPELEAQAEIEGVLGPLLSYGVACDTHKSIVAAANAEGCVDPGMVWYDAAEALLVKATGSGDGLLDYTCDDVIAVMRRLIRDRIQAEHGTLESEPLDAL